MNSCILVAQTIDVRNVTNYVTLYVSSDVMGRTKRRLSMASASLKGKNKPVQMLKFCIEIRVFGVE